MLYDSWRRLFMTRLRHFGRATLCVGYSDWIAAALVTLCAVYLHALFFLNAGGLWRDEVELVHLSLLPSFSEVWQNLPHDSCPILIPLVVRAWSAAGFGNTDPGLRVFRAPAGDGTSLTTSCEGQIRAVWAKALI